MMEIANRWGLTNLIIQTVWTGDDVPSYCDCGFRAMLGAG